MAKDGGTYENPMLLAILRAFYVGTQYGGFRGQVPVGVAHEYMCPSRGDSDETWWVAILALLQNQYDTYSEGELSLRDWSALTT